MSDPTELTRLSAALRGMPGAGPRIAAATVPHLYTALHATLSAGATPDGAPWAPRKTGGRAYAHAADHIAVKPFGDIVRVTLSGPEVYGQFGARGAPVRRMIPEGGAEIPQIVADAIVKGARDVFGGLFNG